MAATQRITIRIPGELEQRLRKRSSLDGTTESEVLREALENYLAAFDRKSSAYALAEEAGLVGCVSGAPQDLSTNRRHFEGTGKNK